jgi:hypothetical protein
MIGVKAGGPESVAPLDTCLFCDTKRHYCKCLQRKDKCSALSKNFLGCVLVADKNRPTEVGSGWLHCALHQKPWHRASQHAVSATHIAAKRAMLRRQGVNGKLGVWVGGFMNMNPA